MYLDHFSAILGFTFDSAQCNRKSAICGLKNPIWPEVPIPVADQKDRGLWERDWHSVLLRNKYTIYYYSIFNVQSQDSYADKETFNINEWKKENVNPMYCNFYLFTSSQTYSFVLSFLSYLFSFMS